jgi:hypothetical protein
MVLAGDLNPGDQVTVDEEDGRLSIDVMERERVEEAAEPTPAPPGVTGRRVLRLYDPRCSPPERDAGAPASSISRSCSSGSPGDRTRSIASAPASSQRRMASGASS